MSTKGLKTRTSASGAVTGRAALGERAGEGERVAAGDRKRLEHLLR